MASVPEIPLYDGPAVYPQGIILSILATIATLLTIPPLILNIRSSNLAITTLILSTFLVNLQNTINPIIWPNDNIQAWFNGHILCDIEAKLLVGIVISVPSSTACISRHLASIFSTSRPISIVPSPHTARNRLIFDVTLCIIFPLTIMSVHIFIQPYRYGITGITGCQFSLDRSWPTLVLFLIWPILASLLGAVYNTLIIIRLLRHRRQVSSLLGTANVSTARFARVFALALAWNVVYLPLGLIGLTRTVDGLPLTWSWEDVHPVWWSETVKMLQTGGVVGFERWMQVSAGFVVFAVFGLGSDAVVVYRGWAERVGLVRLWTWVRQVRRRN